MKRAFLFGAIALLIIIAGCTTGLRNKQLEKVAKDWALVIRASQVTVTPEKKQPDAGQRAPDDGLA